MNTAKCRTAFLLLLAALLAGCGSNTSTNPSDSGDTGTASAAPNYPMKAITLICPWAAGGGTDRLSRFMADQLQRELKQPVIVVNRTGGSGASGHSAGALAAPDGYTVTMATFELSTMHWMGISELSYKDFEPVIQLNADAAAILVRSDSPWNSLADLLEFIKQNPKKLKMSGTATGGAWDLARAGFLLAAGLPVDSVLWVPAQGAAPALVQLLGGHIDSICCSLPEAAPQLEAGQLRALAVMASERVPEFPEVKTAKEQGIDWEAIGWRGLAVPKGTPREIVDLLSEKARKIAESEPFKEFMRKNGFAIALRGPDEFGEFLKEQDAQWEKVITAAGYARQ